MADRPAIAFLFNHDAGHQIAHSIGIAAALAERHPRLRTVIVYGSDAIRQEIEKHLTAAQVAALDWQSLALDRRIDRLLGPLNRLFPARRLARLVAGARALRGFAMIVSTERTCLMLKRRWGAAGPAFAYIPHGSGDRNVAYHPALKDFDLMLLSGRKLVDQMVAHGIAPADRCRIIGYPKFDRLAGRAPERFFADDNPVFVYNPHFDPVLSSWYDEGEAVLDWFLAHPHYNLIFAPHVMLFRKKTHLSPEYRKGRRRPDIAERFRDAPNILIDVDSPRLFDMSYTIAADAYIGDVSSQVYEFLYRPRPVFFIDVHSDAAGDAAGPAYEFWRNGPVVASAEELGALLPEWQAIGDRHRAEQVRLMDYTADRSDPRPAAVRGAEAIAGYIRAG